MNTNHKYLNKFQTHWHFQKDELQLKAVHGLYWHLEKKNGNIQHLFYAEQHGSIYFIKDQGCDLEGYSNRDFISHKS